MRPMRVGYARVSRRIQRLKPQRDAPLADGCERVFEEKVFSGKSGRKRCVRLSTTAARATTW
jgi:DNA invertase Pin-like site-specific DNA recombinase